MSLNSEIIAAVDIGTATISAFVGRLNADKKIELIAFSEVPSSGIKRGMILNQEEAVKSIRDVMAQAVRGVDVQIHKVFVGMNGQHIHTISTEGNKQFDEPRVVTNEDVKELELQAARVAMRSGECVYRLIPQEFKVDQEDEILNPVGISGRQVSGAYKILVGSEMYKETLNNCMNRAGWPVHRWFLSSVATADVTLTADEKEAGVVLVDMGAGSTSVSVYYEGVLRYESVIPFGGDVVTKDIKQGCSVLQRHAEMLKVQCGSALSSEAEDDQVVTIPAMEGWDSKEISVKMLASIIEARMEELIDSIAYQIEKSGYWDRLGAGIVLTGGAAQLKNVLALLKFRTGINARLGLPRVVIANKNDKKLVVPSNASGLGILQKGLELADADVEVVKPEKKKKKKPSDEAEKPDKEGKKKSLWGNMLGNTLFSIFDEDDSEVTK
ncbi:cell division protein FtsA [Prolixibacteraceae bacterium JC049]|nr:cell division protein FtsA [Prolixibacteraceae bacterium JC049]